MDAADLNFDSGSFDAIFMSHLLHHMEDSLQMLRNCFRILRSPGSALIRYGAMEQIKNDIEHTLFPEVSDIDMKRTPSKAGVENWLSEAGFSGIYTVEVIQKTYETPEDHLNAARAKSTSVLSMISDDAFRKGIRNFEDYINKHPDDEWLMFDRMMITVGKK